MNGIALDAVTARYRRTGPDVVRALSLRAEEGRLTALLGPSGCGKTTVLRLVAGLLDPVGGDIRVAGRSVLGVPAERRRLAVVFQQPLLFPHLDVAGNIGFGLRMRGVDRATLRRRVGDLVDLMRLTGLERRRPDQLSGGQAQRVALARAIIVRPAVLLLDEPLTGLDAGLRGELLEQIRTLQRDLRLTTVFVTHDQAEAATVSDEIALLLDGRIDQHGPPQDLYRRPGSVGAARFLGTANLFAGRVEDGVWSGPLHPLGPFPTEAPDGPGTLAIRQEALQVSLDTDAPGPTAVVTVARYRGTSWTLHLQVDGTTLVAVTPPTVTAAPGDLVRVSLPAGHAHVIPGVEGS
jgi:putative spermidine/putrescine transport system ATP-binding protein